MQSLENQNQNREQVLLQWEAPEFIKPAKSYIWFAGAILAVAGMVVYAVKTHSLTMAVAFIVLAGVYAIAHHREPGRIPIQITTLGIAAGKTRIPYNQIKAFWLVYEPPHVKVLKLLTTDKLMAELTLQLDGQDPGEVRELLVKQVPEHEGRGENLVDVLIRVMKL